MLSQGHPRINIGRIIVEVDQDVIALAKSQAAGKKAQTQRGGANERHFFGLAIEQLCRQLTALAENHRIDKCFLVARSTLLGVFGNRFGNTPWQRANPGVTQKDSFAHDGELALAHRLVCKQLGNRHGR